MKRKLLSKKADPIEIRWRKLGTNTPRSRLPFEDVDGTGVRSGGIISGRTYGQEVTVEGNGRTEPITSLAVVGHKLWACRPMTVLEVIDVDTSAVVQWVAGCPAVEARSAYNERVPVDREG